MITLNSPKTLNSLSVPMIEELYSVLKAWRADDAVSCVFLQGSGEKAFCAGGDVRRLYDAIIAQRNGDANAPAPECVEFFSKEYRTDHEIHRYPKPVIVWGDGIVMGGGIGLMAGASHRVVTERSKLAMPEITIGLYPDVGGTWFLNQLPQGWGEYLGLTGARLNASDCLHLGMADYFTSSVLKSEALEALTTIGKCHWSPEAGTNRELVSTILKSLDAKSLNRPPSPAKEHERMVARMSGVKSPREFRNRLEELPARSEWILAGIKNFDSGSPSSAYIILEQLRRGKGTSLEDVFRSELNLSIQCMAHPDFSEGIRALLVDKDQNPKWQPKTLDEVTPAWVESYFTPVWKNHEHPLRDLGRE